MKEQLSTIYWHAKVDGEAFDVAIEAPHSKLTSEVIDNLKIRLEIECWKKWGRHGTVEDGPNGLHFVPEDTR